MKVTLTHNGKSVEYEISDSEFNKLFNKTGYERQNEVFYAVDTSGNIDDFYSASVYADECYEFGNYYSDEVIDEFKNELMWYFKEFKDRMY